MSISQEAVVTQNPVLDVVKAAVLTIFTFLSALSVREALIKTLEAFVPDETKQRLIFIYFSTSIIVLITLVLAYMWQDINK